MAFCFEGSNLGRSWSSASLVGGQVEENVGSIDGPSFRRVAILGKPRQTKVSRGILMAIFVFSPQSSVE